jgi:phosphatidate phosphatase PAH1
MSKISHLLAILFLFLSTSVFGFEQGQQLDSINDEISFMLRLGIPVHMIYHQAKETEIGNEMIAALIIKESTNQVDTLVSLFFCDVNPRTIAILSNSLGVSSNIILTAALNAGIDISDLFEETSYGIHK